MIHTGMIMTKMKPAIDWKGFAVPKNKPTRLKGAKYTEFKRELYKKYDGRCYQCGRWRPLTINGVFDEYRCAHVSHIKHGAQKEDTLKGARIACFDCHRKSHNGKI